MKSEFIEIEKMPNGEKRGRMKISENVVFSYTSTKDKYGWQNAHYHKYAEETYFVKKGKILLALRKGHKIKLKKLAPGDKITVPAGLEHNIHVGKNTLFYVTKRSQDGLEDDWYGAKYLDEYTKSHKLPKVKKYIFENS